MRKSQDISKEIEQVLDRTNLKTAVVKTTYSDYRFTTVISGADPARVQLALVGYTASNGERFIGCEIKNGTFILRQWDR